MSKTSKGGDVLKLYYFPIRARAEALRMSLAFAGVPYEDIRISFEDWRKPNSIKQEAPYGQLPFIVHQGQKYGESKALASFIARMCNLAGQTAEHAMRVDEVYSLIASLMECLGKAHFEKDPEKLAETKRNLAEETIPKYLRYFENLLDQTGDGYFVASTLTLADFAVFDITHSLLKTTPKVLDDFPKIRAMRDKVQNDPKMKIYLASRPDTNF